MLLTSDTDLEKSLQPSLTWDISPLFATNATEYRRASFKIRQNYLKSQPRTILGGFHKEVEYFDVEPNPTVYSGPHRYYPANETVVIVFEKSEESVQTTVLPEFTILGFLERIGGGAVLILFICKTFVGSVERKMVEADLIRNFYQVEKDTATQWKDDEERAKPPKIIGRGEDALGDEYNTPGWQEQSSR